MSRKIDVKQFTLYIIIGIVAAVADYGIFYFLEKSTPKISPEFASVLGQLLGFLISFFLNTFYNFKKTDKLFRRFISYFTICLVGMVISTVIIHALKGKIDIFVLKFACLILVSVIQFLLNKLITYKN
ncbi:MAG: GtrA family protein [Oscillospiraceae bacterium]